jgi:hypothetical protein
MLIDTTRDLGAQIAAQVKERFGFWSVAFCDGLTGDLSMAGAPDARVRRDIFLSAKLEPFGARREFFNSQGRFHSQPDVGTEDLPPW